MLKTLALTFIPAILVSVLAFTVLHTVGANHIKGQVIIDDQSTSVGHVLIPVRYFKGSEWLKTVELTFALPSGLEFQAVGPDPNLGWNVTYTLEGDRLTVTAAGNQKQFYGTTLYTLKVLAPTGGVFILKTISARHQLPSGIWEEAVGDSATITIRGPVAPKLGYSLSLPPEINRYNISTDPIYAQAPYITIQDNNGETVYAGQGAPAPLEEGTYTFTLQLQNSLPVTVTAPLAPEINMGIVYLGDVNGDRIINVLDFSAMLEYYQQPSPHDVTMDGLVDMLDLAFVQHNFNQQG